MPFDFTAGIVRILGPNKATAGTGFVMNTEGFVGTCAHVVEDARVDPGNTISLIFYAAKDKGELKATVLPEYWRASNTEDVAILRLEGMLPEGVEPLPLVPYLGKHDFSTFGFPKVAPIDGRQGQGKMLGPPFEVNGFDLLQLRSEEITTGISGAPVWDDELEAVIGMVISIGKGRSIKWDKQEVSIPADPFGRFKYTAYATPTETLWKIYPDLRPAEWCAYRKLDVFTKDDERLFFGRERVLDELEGSLRNEPRFLAVLGPSGCGKSSLVQAGLIPRLREEAVFGSNLWEIIITRPTDDAFKNVVTSLYQEKQQPFGLIIDQFEELFVAYPETKCQEMVTLLTNLLEMSPHIHLILTLRDDFYSHFVQFEALEKWLKKGMVNVPPVLRYEEVRAIIQKPAEVVRLRFEEGLVEIIVKDVRETYPTFGKREPGVRNTMLPLLELALTQLWERRDRERGILTLTAYNIIGGVTGSLKQWANETYFALEKSEQLLARRIFTDLVYLGDESQQVPDSSRRRPVSELIRNESERKTVEQVVQQLTDARLLVTTSPEGQGQEKMVEIIHDALLYEWSELRGWVADNRRFLVWRQELERKIRKEIDLDLADVAQHDENRENIESIRLRGRELVEAVGWMSERKIDLTPEEQGFIQASRERQRQEETRWKELYEEAEQQRQEAERQRRIALARQLAAQSELILSQHTNLLERSVLLAVEAMQQYPCLEADKALRRGLSLLPHQHLRLNHNDIVRDVAFSPDGRYLATASRNGTASVWEVSTGLRLSLVNPGGDMTAVGFSPDGRYLATASGKGAGVWEVTTGRQLFFTKYKNGAQNAVFSPDGRYLATTSMSRSAEVFEMPSGRQLLRLTHKDEVKAVAFSPDGKYIATASYDSTARVWNAISGHQLAILAHENILSHVAFSPDGHYIVTISLRDNMAVIWDTKNGNRLAVLSHRDLIWKAAFSPDSAYVATASADHTAVLWDVKSGRQLALLPHIHTVWDVIFSDDSNYLATASEDETAAIWAAPSGRQLVCAKHNDLVWAVAFSPDGNYLATASRDGTARVWETKSGHDFAHSICDGDVHTVAFSPNSNYLAVANFHHKVWLLETISGHQLFSVDCGDFVWAVVFSPDGRYFATANGKGVAQVWETISGREVLRLAHEGKGIVWG